VSAGTAERGEHVAAWCPYCQAVQTCEVLRGRKSLTWSKALLHCLAAACRCSFLERR